MGFDGQPCHNDSCAVCSIIRGGFKMKYAGQAVEAKLGAGIYSSSNPAKAFKYGNKRAMFVTNVACGVADVSKSFGDLPRGTHSRIANVGDDECVVFEGSAMVPRYLLIFAASGA